MPQWGLGVLAQIGALDLCPAKSELSRFLRVNKYLPGQGIRPHTDFKNGSQGNVALTLGSGILIDFHRPFFGTANSNQSNSCICSVYLEPRSLFAFSDKAFFDLFHGIRCSSKDLITNKVLNRSDKLPIGMEIKRGIRYSVLTFF